MKKEIILEIIGLQQIDSQKDKIELTTVGNMIEEDDYYLINYTEEQEAPLKNIDSSVKIYKNNKIVEMSRTGAYDSCLVIEKSKRNLCQYATQYGDMLMGIYGKEIICDVEKSKGSFNFIYDIDINGSVASKNEVKMTYKYNQEN